MVLTCAVHIHWMNIHVKYIHGRNQTTMHTDQRLLIPIFTKSNYNAPKRLQGMLLRFQKYNLNVTYTGFWKTDHVRTNFFTS